MASEALRGVGVGGDKVKTTEQPTDFVFPGQRAVCEGDPAEDSRSARAAAAAAAAAAPRSAHDSCAASCRSITVRAS